MRPLRTARRDAKVLFCPMPLMSWREALWVALGSGAGGLLRFAAARLLHGLAPGGIHIATLLVNVLGSALFGWLMARHGQIPMSSLIYLSLTTGVLGGFTTYSTFNTELLRLAIAGQPGRAGLYAAVTLASCLLGGAAGWWLALRS